MTDRVYAFTVALVRDIRDDDVEHLKHAIECLRGVLSVGLNIASPETFMAEQRARHELGQKLIAVIYPERTP